MYMYNKPICMTAADGSMNNLLYALQHYNSGGRSVVVTGLRSSLVKISPVGTLCIRIKNGLQNNLL